MYYDMQVFFMKKYFSLIKFSHTIFALPFAILGFALGWMENGNTTDLGWLLTKVILSMIFARSAAMAFNRYTDRKIDLKNPRTRNREIPAGKIQASHALVFVLINGIFFMGIAFLINRICFYLSPLALLIILGYSYTKRFTFLCHFILGLGLSLAPIGAYLAVTGSFALLPILYSLCVFVWVSGFDIIYALQDEEFDNKENLFSLPAKLGKKRALGVSTFLHVMCAILVLIAGYLAAKHAEFYILHWIGAFVFVGLLIHQHRLVKPDDLSKVNLAFFTANGFASILFCTLFIADLWL
jgi:4-hydroxybenzoate polyprenyltransferase